MDEWVWWYFLVFLFQRKKKEDVSVQLQESVSVVRTYNINFKHKEMSEFTR